MELRAAGLCGVAEELAGNVGIHGEQGHGRHNDLEQAALQGGVFPPECGGADACNRTAEGEAGAVAVAEGAPLQLG
eukprot:11166708-Lingulodinium_polyedra.AAC.1